MLVEFYAREVLAQKESEELAASGMDFGDESDS